MLNSVKGLIVKSVLGKIAGNPDSATTLLGLLAGAVVASKVDFGKLVSGDGNEIGTAIGAVVVALIGWYTNRKKGS